MARANRSIVNSKPNTFNSTWKTDNTSVGSSAANQIALPLSTSGSYNFVVYWGDNTSSSISSALQPEVTHSYATAGTYNVTMSGYIKGWTFNNGKDRRKIINISQWGGIKLSSNGSQFYGCDALTLNNISDTPNLYCKNVNPTFSSSIANVFRSCSLLTTISRLDQWDTSQVQYMGASFYATPSFNQNIGSWNIGRVTNMESMFSLPNTITGSFDNGGSDSIGNWDTSNVTSMASMFQNQPYFNRNISSWNTSNVTNFGFMFYQAINDTKYGIFNQDISNWDTSKATTMIAMFMRQREFNQEVGKWNVGNVTDMSFMFRSLYSPIPGTGSFNNAGSPSIGNWNTSKVTTMGSMFSKQNNFNQNIGNWNTSNVTNMSYMFQALTFNNGGSDSINNWNTSKVANMSRMFQDAMAFNQPLNNWRIPLVTDMLNFMYNGDIVGVPYAFSVENYSNLLISFASQSVKPNVSLRVYQYYNSNAVAARAVLAAAPNNWTFIDRGLQP